MTIGGTLRSMGMREIRANIRAIVEDVEAGQPLVVLRDGQPSAVLISHDEAERWRRIEEAFAALHGLDVYPELARDTAELAALVDGSRKPDRLSIEGLYDLSRAIRAPLRTKGVTDARLEFATLIDEVSKGRTTTIVSHGKLAVAVIPPREYDRLRELWAVVRWFRAAGLDLAEADEAEIARFVNERRQGGSQRVEKAAG